MAGRQRRKTKRRYIQRRSRGEKGQEREVDLDGRGDDSGSCKVDPVLGDFPQHFLPPLSNVQQSFIDLCLMSDQEWVDHHSVQLLGALHNHTHTHI